jgi:hypothetical protein
MPFTRISNILAEYQILKKEPGLGGEDRVLATQVREWRGCWDNAETRILLQSIRLVSCAPMRFLSSLPHSMSPRLI